MVVATESGVAKTNHFPNTGNLLLSRTRLRPFEMDRLEVELRNTDVRYRMDGIEAAIRNDLLYPEPAETREFRNAMGINFVGRREMAMLTDQMGEPEMARSPRYLKAGVLANKDDHDHLLICLPQMSGEELEEYVGPLMAPNQNLADILKKDGGYGIYNGWRLIRKTPIPGSAKKTAEQQNSMKDSLGYATPTITLMLFVMATVHKLSQERMFAKQFVRIALNQNDDHSYAVGWPTPAGIEIRRFWTDERKSNLLATGYFREPER